MDEQAWREKSVEILTARKEWRQAHPKATYAEIEDEVGYIGVVVGEAAGPTPPGTSSSSFSESSMTCVAVKHGVSWRMIFCIVVFNFLLFIGVVHRRWSTSRYHLRCHDYS